MFSYIFITLLLSKTVLSQINGEFWWMNKNLAKIQQAEAPPPKFDDVNEFETDESVKVIFKDNELESKEENDFKIYRSTGKTFSAIYFRDQSELSKPSNVEEYIFNNQRNVRNLTDMVNYTDNIQPEYKKESYFLMNKSKTDGDEFVFVFPINNEFFLENKRKQNDTIYTKDNSTNNNYNISKPNNMLSDKVWFEEETKQYDTESICTFMSTQECILNKGVIHTVGHYPKNTMLNSQKICCILPLQLRPTSKICQPTNCKKNIKRYKRSDPGEKLISALKQRDALLERKYNIGGETSKLTATTVRSKPIHKIVTPEYVDPYWNIKNLKFRNPGLQSNSYSDYQSTKYGYGNQDYVEDYAMELPKPGLIGLYSDHEDTREKTTWKGKNKYTGNYYEGTDDVGEEDDGESDLPFGYSTFDPRLGDRVSTDNPRGFKRKPQRITTITNTDDDAMKYGESHTIHFHSTPDFHVLQGFKLVNLAGNKNRYVRKTTTERFYDNLNEDTTLYNSSPVMKNSNEDYIDGIDFDQQVYKNCGRVIKKSVSDLAKEAEEYCDPWLAVVVLTKHPTRMLCYATVVHPRAAITAADCVNGKTPGEISIVSGIRNFEEDREQSQNRMSTVYTNLNFKPGDLANDLALLHWNRPLRIDAKVQPACLANPHVGDNCYFVGWGGYDQALQARPRWQHATILALRSCTEKLSSPDVNIPAGAFCASVTTRGTVTGVGGPLLCKNSGRISIVGVAVYREDIVVLLPTIDWVLNTLRELHIN